MKMKYIVDLHSSMVRLEMLVAPTESTTIQVFTFQYG